MSQGLRSSENGGEIQSWSQEPSPYPVNCPCRLAVLQSSTNLLLHSDTNVKRLLELCLSEGLQTALQSQKGNSVHSCLFFSLLSALLWVGKFSRSSEGVELQTLCKSEVQQSFPVHTFQPIPLVLMWGHIQSRDGFLWSVNINLPKRCGWDYIKRILTSCNNATVVTLALMNFTGFLNVQIKMFY